MGAGRNRACYGLSVYVGQIDHALADRVELCSKIA